MRTIAHTARSASSFFAGRQPLIQTTRNTANGTAGNPTSMFQRELVSRSADAASVHVFPSRIQSNAHPSAARKLDAARL